MKRAIKLLTIEEDSLRGDRARARRALEEVVADLRSSTRLLENMTSLDADDARPRDEALFQELDDQARRLRLLAGQVLDAGAKVVEISGRVSLLADMYLRDQDRGGAS